MKNYSFENYYFNNSDVKEAKKIIKRADIPLINDYN